MKQPEATSRVAGCGVRGEAGPGVSGSRQGLQLCGGRGGYGPRGKGLEALCGVPGESARWCGVAVGAVSVLGQESCVLGVAGRSGVLRGVAQAFSVLG